MIEIAEMVSREVFTSEQRVLEWVIFGTPLIMYLTSLLIICFVWWFYPCLPLNTTLSPFNGGSRAHRPRASQSVNSFSCRDLAIEPRLTALNMLLREITFVSRSSLSINSCKFLKSLTILVKFPLISLNCFRTSSVSSNFFLDARCKVSTISRVTAFFFQCDD
jgi:hypothetical protein